MAGEAGRGDLAQVLPGVAGAVEAAVVGEGAGAGEGAGWRGWGGDVLAWQRPPAHSARSHAPAIPSHCRTETPNFTTDLPRTVGGRFCSPASMILQKQSYYQQDRGIDRPTN